MTGNQTMDYYVRPQHLYSHSRTCTRSGLCRIPSRLVASLICYLLDHASVHEISALVTWFQYMSDISSHYGHLDLLYIFSHLGDHGPLYIFIMEILIYRYCTWRWPHMSYFVSCLFMAIVLLCIWDCCMYLQYGDYLSLDFGRSMFFGSMICNDILYNTVFWLFWGRYQWEYSIIIFWWIQSSCRLIRECVVSYLALR